MEKVNEDCLFCDSEQMSKRIVNEFNYWFVVRDNFPVSKGHTLIVLKRHYPDMFELTVREWIDLQVVLENMKEALNEEFCPDGYDLSVNCEESEGQTIFHLHIHLIPRYKEDVENPSERIGC